MSQPPNALDAYRTYSYHHILIAADSTATADRLSDESDITKYDHPNVRFCPQSTNDGGKYIVLINGMTDAQFVVQSAKWSTVPIPSVSSTTSSTVTSVQTLATDGELEILEPQGVNFFNVLSNATLMLKVDPALITFVLKTIFVGHLDDGNSMMITTVRPLSFLMVDITAKIDESGATYNMAFVGAVNGAAKLPHVNSIVSGLTFNVAETLGTSFENLGKKINTLYGRMYSALTKAGGNCGVKLDADEFSEVTYNFILDSKYSGMKAGDHKDDKFKNSTAEGGYISNLGDMASIESIISCIMMTSSEVVEQAKGKLPDERFMFKISSDIKTDAKTGKFTVNYYIHQYKAVVVPAAEFKLFEPEEGQGITFDYIFTGKNIDIVDLDIKMEYGLMFFQVLSAQGTSPTSALHLLKNYNSDTFVKGSGSAKSLGDDGRIIDYCEGADTSKTKIKRPLFLGTTLNNPLFRDTSSIGASASFNSMLTRHAAVETLGVKMSIRGNPQLLAESTQQSEDVSSFVGNLNPEVIIPPEGDATLVGALRNIMPRIHRTPAYVKIKVWSPKSWSSSGEKTDAELAASYENDYSENLWYDGWYYMTQIDNIFDGGTFTQEIDLLSLPTEFTDNEADEKCRQEFENSLYDESTKGGAGAAPVAPDSVPTETAGTGSESTNVPPVTGNNVKDSAASDVEKSRQNTTENVSAPGDAIHTFNIGGA